MSSPLYRSVSDSLDDNENAPQTQTSSGKRRRRSWACLWSWSQGSWTSEILCLILGCLLVLTLCLVLAYHDGKKPPDFGSDNLANKVTLNTVVSIITTAAKAFLMVPLLECVSQQKWLHVAQGYRNLKDLSTFDRASRGLVGGLGLLSVSKLSKVAAMSPFLMLLAIALDPFSQQLVSSKMESVPLPGSRGATIGYATNWTTGNSYINHNGGDISSGLIENIDATILWSGNMTIPDLQPSNCPGGNCTFDGFLTLAVCPRFENVTSSLVEITEKFDLIGQPGVTGNHTMWCLFGDFCLDSYYICQPNNCTHLAKGEAPVASTVFNMTSAFTNDSNGQGPRAFGHTIAFTDIASPITDNFILVQSGFFSDPIPGEFSGSLFPPKGFAFEFVLEWCVLNMSTHTVNNEAVTQRLGQLGKFELIDTTRPLSTGPLGPMEQNFTVSFPDHYNLQLVFEYLLEGAITSDEVSSALAGSFIADEYPNGGYLNTTGFETNLVDVATAMTNFFRSTAADEGSLASGTTYQEVTLVVIRWKWISGLLIFTVSILTFLIVTTVAQNTTTLEGTPAWKSSTFALMHAFDPDLCANLGGITDEMQLLAQDRNQRVKLCHVPGEGWRLRAAMEKSERS